MSIYDNNKVKRCIAAVLEKRGVKKKKAQIAALLGKTQLSRRELQELIDLQMALPERDVNPRLINACHQLLYPQAGDGLTTDQAILAHRVGRIQEAARGQLPPSRRLRPAMVVAVVLAAVLLLGAVAQALGYPVWETVFGWTDDDLIIETTIRGGGKMKEPAAALPVGDDPFSQALRERGMAVRLPTKLPRGFVLESVEIDDNDIGTVVIGHYAFGERIYMIDVTKEKLGDAEYRAEGSYLPKNPGPPEIIAIDGVDIYLYGNVEWENAYWLLPPYQVHLTGLIEREEMREIVNTLNIAGETE